MESMYGVFIGGTGMVIFALVLFLIDRRSRKARHHWSGFRCQRSFRYDWGYVMGSVLF